jgi:hypothetical protein
VPRQLGALPGNGVIVEAVFLWKNSDCMIAAEMAIR